jgi:DNA-binding NtrC family response regulator
MAQAPILVIEDDADLLFVIKSSLQLEGFRVVSTESVELALSLVVKEHPAAILLDMRLPKIGGNAFLEAYINMPVKHAPIIVMSSSQQLIGEAQGLSAVHVLQKPFENEALIQMVKTCIGE